MKVSQGENYVINLPIYCNKSINHMQEAIVCDLDCIAMSIQVDSNVIDTRTC